MADIFISYARADREKVEKLAAALEEEGYSVWWDRQIVGGAEFSKAIEKELNDAKAVIVAWSKQSIESRWVKDEAVAAADAGKLIPISIDGAEAPMGFRQFHLIALSGWKNDPAASAFQDLSRAVKARVSGEAQAAPPAPVAAKASWTDRLLKPIPLAVMGVVALLGVFASWQLMNQPPSFEARPSGLAPQDEGGEIGEVNANLHPEEAQRAVTKDGGSASSESGTAATNTSPHPEVRPQGASKDGVGPASGRARGDGDNPLPPEKSIAVLPFADMSESGDQEYFSDGMAEEILNLLAKSSELKVAGRTSSFSFKGRNEDLRGIGEALGVATILEGSLRKSGERVRITAQLIRTSDGFHLWSETYDGDLTDIFALQEEIATAIAAELRAPLGLDTGALAEARTQDIEAYEHYLAGMAQYELRGAALIEAIENFRAAVALDPAFAAAWAGLANAYSVLPGWLSEYQGAPTVRPVIYSKARYAALRAQELNPNLAQTLNALGNMHQTDHQWERNGAAASRAYELAPNSAPILEDYYEFLQFTGQWEKALPIAEHLVVVDPLKAFNWISLGWARWDMRDYPGAAAAFDKSLGLENRLQLGPQEYIALLLSQGDADAAALVVANYDWISIENRDCYNSVIARYRAPQSNIPVCELYQSASAAGGENAEFSLILYGAEGVLDFLEQNVRDLSGGTLNVNSEAIASVRGSARYKKLIRDAGFERYWRNNGWPSHCRPLGDDDFECTSGAFSDD